MSRNNLHWIILAAIHCLLLPGCGILDPSENERLPDPSYIDEPIILEVSEPVSPPEATEGHYIDMGEDPVVKSGDFNDFLVSYYTPDSCDRNVWIYNYRESEWKQIGFFREHQICYMAFTQQDHLLSARGIDASECLSDDDFLTLKGEGILSRQVTAVRRNERYYALPLPAASDFSGLAYGEGSLWACTSDPTLINRVSPTGVMRELALAPGKYASALAYNGANLWLIHSTGQVLQTTTDGELLCALSPPVGDVGFGDFFPSGHGIEVANERLWLAGYQAGYQDDHVFISEANPEVSCSKAELLVTESFDIPMTSYPHGISSRGLAWDGSCLLVASDSVLYKVTTGGTVVDEYPMPVKYVRDMAWDGEAVWMLCDGPKGIEARDPVIARFKLR